MNADQIIVVISPGKTTLLYSHDASVTRYAVDLFDGDAYACRLNEVPCFRRGTHDRMARLHGDDLTTRQCATFVPRWAA